MHDKKLQLILVTNKQDIPQQSYLEFIALCLKAGVTAVQLREKNLPRLELVQFGSNLKKLLDCYQLPLIINDDVALCQELDAAGVHLGQADTDIQTARSLLGSDKIIGLSTNTLAEIEQSNVLPVDYIGVGAIFPTRNKPDIETIWGLQGLKEAALIARAPVIAIGGLTENNAAKTIQAGAKGIAAIGAFHDSHDPTKTIEQLVKSIEEQHYD